MNLTTHNLISSKPLTINLMFDILERDNMRLALKKVKANLNSLEMLNQPPWYEAVCLVV